MSKKTTGKTRGRAKGQVSKRCLIQDPLLGNFEVHIDDGSKTYMVVNSATEQNEAYCTTLTFALKWIAKKIIVKDDGASYTIKEYVDQMKEIESKIMDLTSAIGR